MLYTCKDDYSSKCTHLNSYANLTCSQIILTGYIFTIYGQWSKESNYGTLSHVLPVELWETSCKSSSLLLTNNIVRGNQGIVASFDSQYYCPWINVIFLHDKQNINALGLMLFFCIIKQHYCPWISVIFLHNKHNIIALGLIWFVCRIKLYKGKGNVSKCKVYAYKATWLALQCINGGSNNTVEGEQNN